MSAASQGYLSAIPLDYLTSAGTRADRTLPLTWYLLIVSLVVIAIFAVLWIILLVRGRSAGDSLATAGTNAGSGVGRSGGGLGWIVWGTALPALPLMVGFVWTMSVLARTGSPPAHPAMAIDVTGHQWWWGVRYHGPRPSDTFTTANEIHIPVGVPVLVRLHGGDVIHSFWVPQLAGKTDTIPGQENLAWLEADRPGRYRGQCTEYCGAQHAKMGFEVVAEPMAEFQRWRLNQLQPAMPPATPEQARGLALFNFRCGLCHAVRGTTSDSHVGPDLSHLMSRRMIAAAMLPNNPGSLSGWIQDPQSIKPGAHMPPQDLTGAQLTDVRAYLETLR